MKYCPYLKNKNNRKNREEAHFTEEMEETKRRKNNEGEALEARAHDITIGKHEGLLKKSMVVKCFIINENLWSSLADGIMT